MRGQTTIHPCWFCGEPSVEEIELVPPGPRIKKGDKIIYRAAIRGWVCHEHRQRVEENDGWQAQHRAKLRAVADAAKKDQLSFGDAA